MRGLPLAEGPHSRCPWIRPFLPVCCYPARRAIPPPVERPCSLTLAALPRSRLDTRCHPQAVSLNVIRASFRRLTDLSFSFGVCPQSCDRGVIASVSFLELGKARPPGH